MNFEANSSTPVLNKLSGMNNFNEAHLKFNNLDMINNRPEMVIKKIRKLMKPMYRMKKEPTSQVSIIWKNKILTQD